MVNTDAVPVSYFDHHPRWSERSFSKDMMQGPPGPTYILEEGTHWSSAKERRAETSRSADPWGIHLPPLEAPGYGPIVIKHISGILRQIPRAKFVFKSWKEMYHCETTLKVKSWTQKEITNTHNPIIFTMEISNSSYFRLHFYNSLGKGIFLYLTFQISTAKLRH